MRRLNLARDPFLNRRPVRRLAALLWILAVGLLALDGWVYWRHFVGQGQQEEELAELEPRVAEERQQLDDALSALGEYDLEWQREQVAFLNARIAERTFSWSELFDHLSEVLPRNVRIGRVTPQLASAGPRATRGSQRAPEDEVVLDLSGAAEEDGALLVLVDAFFAHERFRRPNLRVEARREGTGEVNFTMTVTYRPAAPAPRKAKDRATDAREDEGETEAPDPGEQMRS